MYGKLIVLLKIFLYGKLYFLFNFVRYLLDVFIAFIITDNLLLINSFFKIFKIYGGFIMKNEELKKITNKKTGLFLSFHISYTIIKISIFCPCK